MNKDGDATVAVRRHASAGGGDRHCRGRPRPDVVNLGGDPRRRMSSCHWIGRRRQPGKSTSSPRSPGVRRRHQRQRGRQLPSPTTDRATMSGPRRVRDRCGERCPSWNLPAGAYRARRAGASEGEQWRPAEKVGLLPGNKNQSCSRGCLCKDNSGIGWGWCVHPR